KKDFWIIILLFVMTGAAIIVYLNEVPITPRERDYVYVGSFYAFAIFIGAGVLYLYDLLKDKLDPKYVALGVSGVCLLAVPVLMASQNWDDHDRSGRNTAHDFAYNYLIGLDKNALIFTNGDNDTFPLWYIQEVEGVRKDVRVCCMPFLPQDWYIDQLKRTYYDSKALPISMNFEQYRQGKRGMVAIDTNETKPETLKDLMEFVTSDDQRALVTYGDRQYNYFPTATFKLPIDKNKVLASGTVPASRAAEIDSSIVWNMGQSQVYKDELLILDILAYNDWERPIYYTTPRQSGSVKLDDYLELQGLTYRLIPIKGGLQQGMPKMVNTDIMYDNVMNKFRYTNMNNPKVYQDETCRRMIQNMKANFNRLATALLDEGKTDKAVEVLNKLEQALPGKVLGYVSQDVETATLWLRIGDKAKAREISKFSYEGICDNVDYFLSLPSNMFPDYEFQVTMKYELDPLISALESAKEDDLAKEYSTKYSDYFTRYMSKRGRK
ncbi:MAG: hypothetical protein PHY99_03475, partial [Bacteroidales bacterium]|nr:hypothetical protein [Bacteroidales bacterium]